MSLTRINNQALPTLDSDKLPSGTVLQVKSTVYDAQESTSSTSYVASGLTLSITPSSASSKILVCPHVAGASTKGSSAFYRIYRKIGTGSFTEVTGSSSTQNTNAVNNCLMHTGYNPNDMHHENTQQNMSALYLDSPATTSQVTYTIYMRARTSSMKALINRSATFSDNDSAYGSPVSTITLMEVAE